MMPVPLEQINPLTRMPTPDTLSRQRPQQWLLACIIALSLLVAPTHVRATASAPGVTLHHVEVQLDVVHIEFVLFDEEGLPVADLPRERVSVQEGAAEPQPIEALTAQVFDYVEPPDADRTARLFSPAVPTARAATIAILVDASTALGDRAAADSALVRALHIATTLVAIFADAEQNRPYLGLFLPGQNPGDPATALLSQRFTRDYRAVEAALRSLTPRKGATALYDAIATTMAATDAQRTAQGGRGLVIVISDGVDVVNPSASLQTSTTPALPVVSIAVGTLNARQRGAPNLMRLTEQSGGAYLAEPPPDTLAQTVLPFAQVLPAAVYQLRYRTTRYDRGEAEYVRLHIQLADGRTITSAAHALPLATGVADTGVIPSPHHYLLGHLLRVGLPTLAGVVLITMLLGWHRRKHARVEATFS